MQSEPGFDWAVLRRQIEEFATQRHRAPTVFELRRFLAEHGVSPELLTTFLAGMAPPPSTTTPKARAKAKAKTERGLLPPKAVSALTPRTATTTPMARGPEPAVGDSSPAAEVAPTVKNDEPGTQLTRRLAEVVEDLVDDWHRQGGVLQRDQVISLAAKRKLSAPELAVVDEELVRLGIEAAVRVVDPAAHQRPRRSPARGNEDLVGAYLAEIARYRLIDAEEEVRLGRAIQAGQRAVETLTDSTRSSGPMDVRLRTVAAEGRAAHTRMVEANLRLVVSVARQPRYAASSTEYIDRIQDGNRGLLRAADKFDPEMGNKFSTYAMWWIKQTIERGIADTGRAIRLPVHVHEKLSKLGRVRYRLSERLDREPTPAELAEATGYARGEVQAMLDYLAPVRSLEEPVGDDAILSDLLADEADEVDGRGDPQDHFLAADQRHELDAVLDVLPDRNREVVVRRYDLHDGGIETHDAIGRDLGVTRERVRQLEKKAFTMLRSLPEVGALYDYLLTDTRLDRPRPAAGWPPPAPPRAAKSSPAEQGPTPEGQP